MSKKNIRLENLQILGSGQEPYVPDIYDGKILVTVTDVTNMPDNIKQCFEKIISELLEEHSNTITEKNAEIGIAILATANSLVGSVTVYDSNSCEDLYKSIDFYGTNLFDTFKCYLYDCLIHF